MMIVLSVLLLIALLLLAAGYWLFYMGMVRLPGQPDPGRSKWLQPHREEILAGAQWFRSQAPERIDLRSRDGLRLAGYFLPAEEARGTLVLVHGYRSDPFCDFGIIFRFYHELGWNILAVCQRAHGDSEGKYITFGIKERYDILDWTLYLADRFGPAHNIVLDGISMGATTVLMSLALPLPQNVRCAIADCGFTSPYDEFAHIFRTRFHLPLHPLLDLAWAYAKLFAGFGFTDASAVSALETNLRPVLFVHGLRDTLVPPAHTEQNFSACTAEKRLVTVPEAGHGTSYIFDMPRCQAAVRQFLDLYGG